MNAPLPEATLRPAADRAKRQAEVVVALGAVVPAHALLWRREDTVPYECDGLTAYREQPLVVVLPETERQVADVLAICHRLEVPVVARGAGTGLSGGALPNPLGVTLSLAKFNRIVAIDRTARTATVQSGVRNLAISEAARPHGLFYAPRSEQPDRLHDRRQRRRELGRRALPQVRPDAAQRPQGARLHLPPARRSSSAATRSTRPASTSSPR
jgi:hypothetical protein